MVRCQRYAPLPFLLLFLVSMNSGPDFFCPVSWRGSAWGGHGMRGGKGGVFKNVGKNAVLSAIQSVSNKRIAPSSLYALKGLSMHTYTIRNSHMGCQTSQEFQFRPLTLCPTFLGGEKTWSTSKKIFFVFPTHLSLLPPAALSLPAPGTCNLPPPPPLILRLRQSPKKERG